MILSDQDRQEFEQLKQRYERPMAVLLPVLWRLQERQGWIDDAAMQEAADICAVPKSHVMGVVSFYTMFFEKPMGRFHVQVCTNVSCMLMGAEKLYKDMSDRLGIGHMQRTEDGLFSLEEMECMGACGGAPMIGVNETFFERVTAEEAQEIIDFVTANGQIPQPRFTVQMPELSEAANK
jgi:NADH-quinone oxidoreductase subunit E